MYNCNIIKELIICSGSILKLTVFFDPPFGLRTLFRLLRPTNLRVRRNGLGVRRLRIYRASTPSSAMPAVTDTAITFCVVDTLPVQLNNLLNIVSCFVCVLCRWSEMRGPHGKIHTIHTTHTDAEEYGISMEFGLK